MKSIVILMLLSFFSLHATLFHRSLSEDEKNCASFSWKKCDTPAFNELIVSFNSFHFENDSIQIRLRVQLDTNSWSEWFDYLEWGVKAKKTFSQESNYISVFQDTLEIKEGKKACGFEVSVSTKNGSLLKQFDRLIAFCSDLKQTDSNFIPDHSVMLTLPPISQLALDTPHANRICSAVATSSVLSYLTKRKIDPIAFSKRVYDHGHDIYGNWVFATAEAYTELGKNFITYACRLDSFEPIYQNLLKGYPTVISIRGALPGAHYASTSGHLIAITGYHKETDTIFCMDPGYLTDAETIVGYPRASLLAAWFNRGKIAYMFDTA